MVRILLKGVTLTYLFASLCLMDGVGEKYKKHKTVEMFNIFSIIATLYSIVFLCRQDASKGDVEKIYEGISKAREDINKASGEEAEGGEGEGREQDNYMAS